MTRRGVAAGNVAEPAPMSVTEFLKTINELLADQVAWVEGEVEGVRASGGKFLYFALKDAEALVNCFALQFRIRVPLEDGMKVRVWGAPRVYPKYGKFSLNVERLELSGAGALRRAFELLKAKLDAEGLFAPERKRPLPRFPERVGLVTSPDAAAYSDFLKVLRARRGGIRVLFVPVLVQGREAPEQLLSAVESLNEQRPDLDALVIVRGGGGIEDLHSFNDEGVVRAIARSRVPTVVGVGHERDVTLADLVADVRASTPSNAAELLTPTREELLSSLADLSRRLQEATRADIRERERNVARAVAVLRGTAHDALRRVLTLAQRMEAVGGVLQLHLRRAQELTGAARAALRERWLQDLEGTKERLRTALRILHTLHPQRVLARGYSVTRDAAGVILRDAETVAAGAGITTTLQRGTLRSTVDSSSDAWPPKTKATSPRPMKSSKQSSPPSSQATLI